MSSSLIGEIIAGYQIISITPSATKDNKALCECVTCKTRTTKWLSNLRRAGHPPICKVCAKYLKSTGVAKVPSHWYFISATKLYVVQGLSPNEAYAKLPPDTYQIWVTDTINPDTKVGIPAAVRRLNFERNLNPAPSPVLPPT